MDCRVGCAACCIVVSISSPIPGMPDGKPAGTRCIQLSPDNKCKIFGNPERPLVCINLKPSLEMCGTTSEYAYSFLAEVEAVTRPN
jgi:uncharacterized protein